MKNVTLKEMIEELARCLLNDKEPTKFYWKTQNPYTEIDEYKLITEVDLLRDRFKTADDDFNYYEYEIQKSNIYRKEI